jgi:hypothetical protein
MAGWVFMVSHSHSSRWVSTLVLKHKFPMLVWSAWCACWMSMGSHCQEGQRNVKLAFQNMGMNQYLLIPFLGGWTSIYQLFWCSPGVQGFDTLPHLMAEIWWLVNSPWWLGISCTSIFQYDFEKMTITKFFWVYAYLTNPYGLINH